MSSCLEQLKTRNLPELLSMMDGSPVTAENWPARREEIASILTRELFGSLPDVPCHQTLTVTAEEAFPSQTVDA